MLGVNDKEFSEDFFEISIDFFLLFSIKNNLWTLFFPDIYIHYLCFWLQTTDICNEFFSRFRLNCIVGPGWSRYTDYCYFCSKRDWFIGMFFLFSFFLFYWKLYIVFFITNLNILCKRSRLLTRFYDSFGWWWYFWKGVSYVF